MSSDHKFWAAFALMVIAGLVGIFTTVHLIHSYSCASYGAVTGRSVEYFVANGCFVRTDGGLVPVDEYNFRARRLRLVP